MKFETWKSCEKKTDFLIMITQIYPFFLLNLNVIVSAV